MITYHPRKNDKGQPVEINHSHSATTLQTWSSADQLATATPECPMPSKIAGLAVASWKQAPTQSADWERLAQARTFDEPPMKTVAGKKPASGAVVVETDGRVWVVSPSNGFGGYINTFPKGKLDPKEGLSLRANALKEVYEEAGLQVALTGFLCDSVRDTTVTRFYLARRISGNPAGMEWESQAVHLVPMSELAKFASHINDQGVLMALERCLAQSLTRGDILVDLSLSSVYRVLSAAEGFRERYGHWPNIVQINNDMAAGIQDHVLTPLGWALLASKLEIAKIDAGMVIAEGAGGDRYEYGETDPPVDAIMAVALWIWGISLAA